jgi:hypothetical protein
MRVSSSQVRLLETRIAEEGADDVALFDVNSKDDGRSWHVSVFLAPLFRPLCMKSLASVERRRDMVARLGARAIAERLCQGWEPTEGNFLVFAINYPGSPGDPDPLLPYEEVTVLDDAVWPEVVQGSSPEQVQGSHTAIAEGM